jgi:hypothetical protein
VVSDEQKQPGEKEQMVARLTCAFEELGAAAREVEEWLKIKPPVVCICGSSRFVDRAAVVAWEFEKLGVLALGMHLLPAWYTNVEHHLAEHEGVAHVLDELHLRKIEMADFVYVVNSNDYIGLRTAIEIGHALKQEKPVYYAEPSGAEKEKLTTPRTPAEALADFKNATNKTAGANGGAA